MGVKYEYFDELEHQFDLIEVEKYGNYTFEDYYFDSIDNEFYYFNGKQYRKLILLQNRNGSFYVNMMGNDNKRHCVYLNKYKRLYVDEA